MCLVKIIRCEQCFTNAFQIINASTIGELRELIDPIFYTRLVSMGAEINSIRDDEKPHMDNIYYAIITNKLLSEYRIM